MNKNEVTALVIKQIASTNANQITLVKRLIKAAIEELKTDELLNLISRIDNLDAVTNELDAELSELTTRIDNLDVATDELDELKVATEKQEKRILALETKITQIEANN